MLLTREVSLFLCALIGTPPGSVSNFSFGGSIHGKPVFIHHRYYDDDEMILFFLWCDAIYLFHWCEVILIVV